MSTSTVAPEHGEHVLQAQDRHFGSAQRARVVYRLLGIGLIVHKNPSLSTKYRAVRAEALKKATALWKKRLQRMMREKDGAGKRNAAME